MSNIVSIRDKCGELLTPKETLEISFFDKNNKIYPQIKQTLLDYAKFVISKTVDLVPGLKVEDICLSGPLASYFYNDTSSVYIYVIVKNESCDFITKNEKNLTKFLDYMKSALTINKKFNVNKRAVNVTFSTYNIEFEGSYSLLNDKWVNIQQKDIVANLMIDDIMDEYSMRFREIKNHLSQMMQSGELLTIKGNKNLESYYTELYIRSESSIKERIIFKMLVYSGIIKEIQKTFSQNLKKCLSVE